MSKALRKSGAEEAEVRAAVIRRAIQRYYEAGPSGEARRPEMLAYLGEYARLQKVIKRLRKKARKPL